MLYAMVIASGLHEFGAGAHGEVPFSPEQITQRLAMQPYTDAFGHGFDFTFSVLSWPGRIAHPMDSVLSQWNEYIPTRFTSIVTNLFWGLICAHLGSRIFRRTHHHEIQPNVAS